MDQPQLPTGRLTLRPFADTDAAEVARLAGDARVSSTTLNIPHPYSLDMGREWITSRVGVWRSGKGAVFAIERRSDQSLVGAISLLDIADGKAELGYWIGHPYWAQGYCTEAALALIELGFAELGVERIVAEHLASNPASGRVMQKIGMVHVESFVGKDRHGDDVEMELYEILRDG